MIVVSDTTPLNYLVLIKAVDVLPKLFEEIHTPSAVLRELTDARAPRAVRCWAVTPPAWLRIADPTGRLPSTLHLGDGEADTISLAKERGIADVLIDEYLGRKAAASESLHALPTLAILESAAELALLELPLAIDALLRTSYRIRPALLDAALARDAARKL